MTRLTHCLLLAFGTFYLTICQAQQNNPIAAEPNAASNTPSADKAAHANAFTEAIAAGATLPMADVVKSMVNYMRETNQPMTPALQSWINELNTVVQQQQQQQAVQQGNNVATTSVKSSVVEAIAPPSSLSRNSQNAHFEANVVPVNPHIVNNAQPAVAAQPAPVEPALSPAAPPTVPPAEQPQIVNNALTPVQTLPVPGQTPEAQQSSPTPPSPPLPAVTSTLVGTPVQTATLTGTFNPTPVQSSMITSMHTTSMSMATGSVTRSVTHTPTTSPTYISAASLNDNDLFTGGGSFYALVAVMMATTVIFLA